jgi:nicotinamidase-related amidase
MRLWPATMSTTLQIDPARTAVLAADLQTGIVSVYVKDQSFIPRAAQVIADARAAQVPIVYVRVAFRPGVPEASPRNRFLSAVKASPAHQRFFQDESGAIHVGLAPQDGDLVVTKGRISAFAGTDLDLLLRANDVDTLVLFGIATSGAVLYTVLQAVDLDYRVIVIRECCADDDPDLHAVVVDKLLPRYATVASAEDVSRAFGAHR